MNSNLDTLLKNRISPHAILDAPLLQEMETVIGLEAMWRMVDVFGGTRIFIPKKLRQKHRLIEQLGLETAMRMTRHFGGETLSIPRAVHALKKMRDQQIVLAYDQGQSVSHLAKDHGLTERHIYTILSRGTLPHESPCPAH